MLVQSRNNFLLHQSRNNLIGCIAFAVGQGNVRTVHQIGDPYEEDYVTLGVPSTVDAAGARDAFLRLAKRCHPDSKHPDADEAVFRRVELSYRRLLVKFSEERHNGSAVEGEYGLYYEQKKGRMEGQQLQKEEYEMQHARGFYTLKPRAPQHRQYLSCEGLGLGTPAQRDRQYQKYRAMRATENIIDYKVQQLQQQDQETCLVSQEKMAARKIKTRYGIERLVEDLIQESMSRGDFDNLRNSGKPLPHTSHNPYLDLATHKLNQVLIDNGYAPAWVQLERDIREEKQALREKMAKERATMGEQPLSPREQIKWDAFLSSLSPFLLELNKMIDKYNLVVPVLSKQMVHFPLARVADIVVKEGVTRQQAALLCPKEGQTSSLPEKTETVKDDKRSSLEELLSIFKLL